MIADVAGFSRLMERDESRTFDRLAKLREQVAYAKVAEHGGRIIKTTGDGFLADFSSAIAAVRCGVEIQRSVVASEADHAEADRIRFRIGINVGDIIIDGHDVAGDGVNIAARLESMAPIDGLCVSSSVREQIRDDLGIVFHDLGELKLKNILRPIRAFSVTLGGGAQVPVGLSTTIDIQELPLPDKPSIAVLPFANLSGDSEQEYFTDGVTEDIITELSRFHSLFVIARNSTFTYKGKAVDVRTVARELGVRYVLEGSIRRSGDRIRVTGQLIDALTGNHIWAERYDRVLADVFAVQEEVTQSIVTAIAPQIDAAEREHALRRRPESLSAYEIAVIAIARAWESYQKQDRVIRDEVIEKAKAALAIDPRSTLALNALAFAQWQHVHYRTAANLDAAWLESLAAATKAIEVDSADSLGYVRRAVLFVFASERDRWDEALSDARRAHQLNPNDVLALRALGWIEAAAGNPDKALEYLHQSIRISPRDPFQYNTYHALAQAYFIARDYEKAIEYDLLGLSEVSNFAPFYMILAASYVGSRDMEKATTALQRARQLAPEFIQSRLNGGMVWRNTEHRQRFTTFLRIAAGLADPSAADALR